MTYFNIINPFQLEYSRIGVGVLQLVFQWLCNLPSAFLIIFFQEAKWILKQFILKLAFLLIEESEYLRELFLLEVVTITTHSSLLGGSLICWNKLQIFFLLSWSRPAFQSKQQSTLSIWLKSMEYRAIFKVIQRDPNTRRPVSLRIPLVLNLLALCREL